MAHIRSSDSILFRPAFPSELPTLERLHATWASAIFAPEARAAEDDGAIPPTLRRPLTLINPDSPDHRCIVADAGTEIVGLVATLAVTAPVNPSVPGRACKLLAAFLEMTPEHSLHICSLAVLPQWRRRGIAPRLLSIAEIEARTLELPRLSVTLFEANVTARRLFLAAGFNHGHRTRVPDGHGGETLGDILVLHKPVAD